MSTPSLRDRADRVAPDQISQSVFALKEWVEETLPSDFDYVLALPFEERLAEYEQSERPVISIHVHGLRPDLDQPQRWTDLPVTLDGDIYIHQRLIDPHSANLRWLTYYYLWHLAVFLAGRLHRAKLETTGGDGITYNRINVVDVSPDTIEVQENEGAEGFTIQFELPLVISAQTTLLNPLTFQRFFGQPEPADSKFVMPFGGETTETGGRLTLGLEDIVPEAPVDTPPSPYPDGDFVDDPAVQEVLRRRG